MSQFKPRPKQQEVLKYRAGKMGVSAVPGSGKTRTLSYLAASLVADGGLKDGQEILIVTLVNAAADHFARQVGEYVVERGLFAGVDYRVRTLHALANDILRERPGLVGLDKDFKIIDERETDQILQDAVDAWTKTNPQTAFLYITPDTDDDKAGWIAKQNWASEVKKIANVFIRQAKDEELEPDDIRRLLKKRQDQFLPFVQMGLDIYTNYQRALHYRGGVDFQDLIRLALKALRSDPDYLKRLQEKWVYILEDEAQDSSQLQETILRLLVGKKGNWVRVGDPNQAIYETFTTAKPEHLRDFIREKDVVSRELPNSGRNTQSIIKLANDLIHWSLERHPVDAVRARQPLTLPEIQPTPAGDPQPNPPDDPSKVVLYEEPFTDEQEIQTVVNSVARWMPANPDKTVAVLAPRNERGAQIAAALRKAGLDVLEILQSTTTTRETAGALTHVLNALSSPNASDALAWVFRVWRRVDRDDAVLNERLELIAKAIQDCKYVEDYLYPISEEKDWLNSSRMGELMAHFDDENQLIVSDMLIAFRRLVTHWQAGVMLPIDQLILTISTQLFDSSADLAIAHSLAVHLQRAGESNPHWRLPDFTAELKLIAQNKRRVVNLLAETPQHDPEFHKGKVTVATIHAAKGLEWDRVYIVSVNNYDFPSAQTHDRFIGEAWWARDNLNLQAEALEQLHCLKYNLPYTEGNGTQNARINYASERLRLLYVGITRAKRELVITWNTGRHNTPAQEATPLIALRTRQAHQK
jgi:DNA helicase-2/ATP-dependent DNA helicase PcrA